MSESPPPPEAADLYGLPLDEFTPARNQLVKDLKAAKRKDEAALVAKLRKPPATAWALNQVARRYPHLIEDVVAAAGGLRAATDLAIEGDRTALAGAQAAERHAVNEAVDSAAGALTDAGSAAPDSARRKMAESLRAACSDPESLEVLRAGVLTDDVVAGGNIFDLTAAPTPRAVSYPTPSADSRDRVADVIEMPSSRAPVAQLVKDAPAEAPAPLGAVTEAGEATTTDDRDSAAFATQADEPVPVPPSAIEIRADELSRRRLAKRRQDLQEELAVLRQRAARLAEQVTDAEDALVELKRRAAKAADLVTETEAELAELPPPDED